MKIPMHSTNVSGNVTSASLSQETSGVQSLTVISLIQKPGLRALAQCTIDAENVLGKKLSSSNKKEKKEKKKK